MKTSMKIIIFLTIIFRYLDSALIFSQNWRFSKNKLRITRICQVDQRTIGIWGEPSQGNPTNRLEVTSVPYYIDHTLGTKLLDIQPSGICRYGSQYLCSSYPGTEKINLTMHLVFHQCRLLHYHSKTE